MNLTLKPLCHPCFTLALTTGPFSCPWCDAVGNHLTVCEFGSSSPHWCLGEFCSKQRAHQQRRQDSGERKDGREIKDNQSRALMLDAKYNLPLAQHAQRLLYFECSRKELVRVSITDLCWRPFHCIPN